MTSADLSADNKALVEDLYVNIISKGQMDRLHELVADDCLDHGAEEMGWENGFVDHVAWFRESFPDVVVEVNDMVAEDDRVVAYWTMTGTHEGEFWGVQPTGRKISGTAISLLRFRAGQLVEYKVNPDVYGALEQMGVLPPLDELLAATPPS